MERNSDYFLNKSNEKNDMSSGAGPSPTEYYEKLINALNSGKGLQAITDIGSEYLNNSVCIADSSYKILAVTNVGVMYSEDATNTENEYLSIAAESMEHKQFSLSSVNFLKESHRLDLIYQNSAPHIVSKEDLLREGIDSPCSFLDCAIYIKGVLVAILAVSDINRPFINSDLTFCRTLADLTGIELQKNEIFAANFGTAYELLLTDLLEGRVSDRLQIKLRLRSINKSIGDKFYLALVRRFDPKTGKSEIPRIKQSAVRNFFPGSFSVIYKGDIAVLISLDEDEKTDVRKYREFTAFLKESNLKAGISEVFHDPLQMKKYYEQAAKALELGCIFLTGQDDYFYYDLSFFHAMQLASEQINLRDLAHPLVKKLNDSTDESDHELLKTLYFWLFYSRNTEKISKKLNIHKSTLYYRLDKIKEMLGSDLDDGELVFQLMFSFRLIEYYSGFVDKDTHYWFKEIK